MQEIWAVEQKVLAFRGAFALARGSESWKGHSECATLSARIGTQPVEQEGDGLRPDESAHLTLPLNGESVAAV
jgi:hypothetical protein